MPFFFLNLSPLEFFTFLAGISGVVTALYFLDRRRRKRVVSTLRFWSDAAEISNQRSSKKMQQPWSLLLQLLGLLCLLLALAHVHWGTRPTTPQNHVLLIDTSAWATARLDRAGPVLNQEKQLAASYIRAVSPEDQVLLVAADALSVPLGKFTTDRAVLSRRLQELRPGAGSGLDLRHAFSFAEVQLRQFPASARGETVLVSPGYAATPAASPANLRLLSVPVDGRNLAICALSASPEAGPQAAWGVTVTVRNTGSSDAEAVLHTTFSGARLAPRPVTVAAKQETTLEYTLPGRGAGNLLVQLQAETAANRVSIDDSASLTIPALVRPKVVVYSTQPDALVPLFAADGGVTAQFLRPGSSRPDLKADVLVFDRVAALSTSPDVPILSIAPPAEGAPVPVSTTATNARVTHWEGPFLAGSGLRAEDLGLPKTQIFRQTPGSQPVALTQFGIAAVALEKNRAHPRSVILGFDFTSNSLRVNVAAPLLIANTIRWLLPGAARPQTVSALPLGNVQVGWEPGESADTTEVQTGSGEPLAVSNAHQALDLFVPHPMPVHIQTAQRDLRYRVALANAPEHHWSSTSALTGLPSLGPQMKPGRALWQWFALAGALCLASEWLLFGRVRPRRTPATNVSRRNARTPERLSA